MPARESHGSSEDWPPDYSGQHRAYGPRVGDGIPKGYTEVSTHDRYGRKEEVKVYLVPCTEGIGGQGLKPRRFTV